MAKVSTRLLETVESRSAQDNPPKSSAKQVKLTKRFVDALTPNAAGDIWVWCSALPGFGVRVKPSGVKTYVIQYRNRNGRTRRLSIGQHGVLTAEEARWTARQSLAAAKRGEDPSAERHSARQQITVTELCKRYLKEHAELKKKRSSADEDRRLIEKRVQSELGAMTASSVVQADIERLHHSLRKTPYEANRTLALLSKMFNLAEAWGVRPQRSNPCYGVMKFREEKRSRYLSEDELSHIGGALRAAEREGKIQPKVIKALRLLALTGCRLSDIRLLRPQEVDISARVLRLADGKAGARVVALSDEALKLLLDTNSDTPFVFLDKDGRQPLPASTIEDAWRRIRKTAKVEDVRIHDLRHTVGTYGGQAGMNAFTIRDLLGHDKYLRRERRPGDADRSKQGS